MASKCALRQVALGFYIILKYTLDRILTEKTQKNPKKPQNRTGQKDNVPNYIYISYLFEACPIFFFFFLKEKF